MAVLNPIQNGAVLNGTWAQKRPVVTQIFGARPDVYEQFGLDGHNGTDERAKIGTPLYASTDGIVKVKDSKGKGYGLHIKIRNEFKASEVIIAHLSHANVTSGQRVNMGDLIGWSGNSGFSTGPHLHFGYRLLVPSKKPIFEWKVLNYNNGYAGYIDVASAMITFKGTLTRNSI